MKPTDPLNPLDSLSPAPAETPVFSKLRRVVDMSAINPPRTKQRTAQGSANKSTKRTAKPKDQAADATAAPNAPATQTATPEARHAAPVVIKTSTAKRVKATFEAKTTRLTAPAPVMPAQPQNTQPETTPDASDTAQAADKTTSKIRLKHSAVVRLADKKNKKDKAIKAPKILARQLKAEADIKLQHETCKLAENIDEMLLLQSWHAKQWTESLVKLIPTLPEMLPQAMPYVRARFVNNVCIASGRLEATVIDQITSISLRIFTSGQWRSVIQALSERAIFTTSLLNGELPEGIVEIFKQASLSLFPSKLKDFSFSCDCGATDMPCEHACALLITFASELEHDPFNILMLRGMARDALLAELRDARSDQILDDASKRHYNYELPAQTVNFNEYFAMPKQAQELTFNIQAVQNTMLMRLGNPSQWHAPFTVADIINPIIDLASLEAEKLATQPPYEIPIPQDELPKKAPVHQPQPAVTNRAPKPSAKNPKFQMPDLSFMRSDLPEDILGTLADDPVSTAEDIIRWLKTRGASDIRTLARRTRLQKPIIEAFLNAFCKAGLTKSEGEDDKTRYCAIF
ncbi:MAG: hypothetical protein IJ165_12470 [Proteobacteria bacterium]|nr:hypothetical protein [Pseudomonadota bacterium]